MSIHDFHSKLVSGKDEGRLFEALRKLKGLENVLAVAEQEPASWYEWTASPGMPVGAPLAALRA